MLMSARQCHFWFTFKSILFRRITMSDFMDLCLRRQTCRKFNPAKPVEHEKLAKCLEAACLAPSGCNAQPWKFIVVESPEKVAQVVATPQQLGLNPYAADVKAFIVVLEQHAVLMPTLRVMVDSQYFAKGDLGAAVAYICLAAEDQGLSTCIFGMYDRPKLCEILNLPTDTRFAGLIGVGYADNSEVRKKMRKPMAEVIQFV